MTDIFEARDKVPKMLIADDDPAIVRLLADRCVKMGFKVETATNGVQLLIKARRSQPDIIIVDVNMPELDGLSVCSRLLDPGSKPLEVVVVTGSNDPETAERCESLGMFYGRKGPDFWNSVEGALAEIYPEPGGQDRRAGKHGDRRRSAAAPARAGGRRRSGHRKVPRQPAEQIRHRHALCARRRAWLPRSPARKSRRVIITDNYMPDGDAQYLLHRLRSTPATENIPVFVISGQPVNDLTEQTLRREIGGRPGALQVFAKSFDTEELFDVLKNSAASRSITRRLAGCGRNATPVAPRSSRPPARPPPSERKTPAGTPAVANRPPFPHHCAADRPARRLAAHARHARKSMNMPGNVQADPGASCVQPAGTDQERRLTRR